MQLNHPPFLYVLLDVAFVKLLSPIYEIDWAGKTDPAIHPALSFVDSIIWGWFASHSTHHAISNHGIAFV